LYLLLFKKASPVAATHRLLLTNLPLSVLSLPFLAYFVHRVYLSELHRIFYFRAGYIEHISAGVTRTVMIRASVSGSGVITLYEPLYQIAVGDSVSLLPGCMGDPAICDSVFGNKINALWFDMPTKNPYQNSQGVKGI